MTFEQLKEQGEIASEQGRQDEALALLDQALVMAIKDKNYAGAVNVLGHHLHVFKALYQQTHDPAYMELFFTDTQTGLRLSEFAHVDGQPKSVMLLRMADYYFYKKEFSQAVTLYKQAVDELNKAKQQPKETEAEYLGHYAHALVKSGQEAEGFTIFEQALHMLDVSHELRPFHRLVIESGIYLRQAESYAALNQLTQATRALHYAKPLVDELATQHQMTTRQQQWQQLAQHYQISI